MTATAVDANAKPKSRLIEILLLAAILAIGAHLRLRAALDTTVDVPIRLDAKVYLTYAHNMSAFSTFSPDQSWKPGAGPPQPDAHAAPGYPAFLTLLLDRELGAQFLLNVMMAQALIGVLVLALMYPLARGLVGVPAGLASVALTAISPHLITSGTYLLTETLYSLGVMVLALVSVRAARRATPGWFLLAGLALAATVLVRPTLQYLPLLLVPAVALVVPRQRLRSAGALLLGFALGFGPWIVRNEVVLGRSGDSTLMVDTLLHGSYPAFMYEDRPETLGYPYRFDPGAAAATRSIGSVLHAIAERASHDPWRYAAWYLLQKPIYFFDWTYVEGAGDIFVYPVIKSPYQTRGEFRLTRGLAHVLHWPLVALAFVGMFMALALMWRSRHEVAAEQARAMGMVALIMAFAVGLHMVAAPFGRYSVPFRPLTYLLAMYALVALIDRLRAIRVTTGAQDK